MPDNNKPSSDDKIKELFDKIDKELKKLLFIEAIKEFYKELGLACLRRIEEKLNKPEPIE